VGAKSVSAVQVKTGDPAPPPVVSSDCVKLDARNQERREALSEASNDQSIVGPGHSGKGTTMSSCSSSTGGRPSIGSAHSNQKAYEKLPNGLKSGAAANQSEGDRKRVRNGTKATTCGHVHPDPASQKSGHAEARLLDSMSGGALPSKITFNIDWRKGAGGTSKMPCKTCHEYLCKVSKDCDVEILLCDRNNVAHPVPCPASRKNRKALKKKLDARRRSPH
jgi:hypothetical protein